jgi:enoyl-CoA hydratase/carnithine racemase
VGLTKANDFVLTARIFTAKEEEQCGLFTRVVPREQVAPRPTERLMPCTGHA